MLTTVEKVLALKKLELFSRISGEMLADVAFFLEEYSYDKGSSIISEGEILSDLFILVEGELDVISDSRKIDKMFPGQSFGELAVLDGVLSSVSLSAATDAIVLRLNGEDFTDIFNQREEIASGIIKYLAETVRLLKREHLPR